MIACATKPPAWFGEPLVVGRPTPFAEAGVVAPKPGEPFDVTLRRFRREVEKSGILRECRRRQYFTPPSEVRRRKEQRKKRAQTSEGRQRGRA